MLAVRKFNNLKALLLLQKGNNTILCIQNEWVKKQDS